MNIVLCFSGGIASGKTTLAGAVSERTGVPRVSFGSFVRGVARTRGIAEERAALQALGEALIEEMGWADFTQAALGAARWKPGAPLIVDGVRHVAAFEAITRLVAPLPGKLVFVDVPQEIRQARADETCTGGATALSKADTHSTEKEVHGALREMADLLLDGTREPESLVQAVMRTFSRLA